MMKESVEGERSELMKRERQMRVKVQAMGPRGCFAFVR